MDIISLFNIIVPYWILLLLLPFVGYICWKNPYEYNSFEACVTAIGGNQGTTMIPNEQEIDDNLIIPANVTLRFIQGGYFTVAAGKTLTINGQVEAPPIQIFFGTGTVIVNTFPQDEAWWGNPQQLSVGSSFENQPFGFAGKKIQIVNPYLTKDNAYKGQLHCHTTNSDGVDTPVAVATAYRDAGYDFLSITDHDFLTPDPAVAGIHWIAGVEETTYFAPPTICHHIVGTNLLSEKPGAFAPPPYGNSQLVLDMIIGDNAVPSIAHPNNPGGADCTDLELESLAGATSRDGYYAIEVFSWMSDGGGANSYAEEKWDTILSKHIRAFANSVDDCHNIAVSFNYGWVIVFADSLTTANIMNSLKRGNYYSSTGAELAVSVSGKVITATTDSSSTIAFIGVDGTTLQTTPNVTTASYTVTGDELYVRIKVTRNSDGKFAWSNALWIDQVTTTELSRGGTVRGNLHVPNSDLRFAPVDIPIEPTVATDVAGVLNGNYKYKITFVTDIGETSLGIQSANVAPVNQKVLVSDIALGSPEIVKERKIYRTKAGGSTYWLLTTLTDNTTTTYLDNIADVGLGLNYTNRNNTTAGQIYMGIVYSGFLGKYDTAFGQNALEALTTGYMNTAVGRKALASLTAGYMNTALGYQALSSIVNSTQNVAIGVNSLYSLVAGICCVALGKGAGYYETASNKLFIDNANRANEADGRIKALIYGIFHAASANQFVTFNSNVIIRHEVTLMSIPNYANDAAAGVGGLTTGDLYTETGTNPLRVCAKV